MAADALHPTPLQQAIAAIAGDAASLEKHGYREHAASMRRVVDQLMEAIEATENQLLTIADAAAFSGFDRSHLARLVRGGMLRNYGSAGKFLLRRRDLPKKYSQSAVPALFVEGATGGSQRREVARSRQPKG
jgi:hypothetical protein